MYKQFENNLDELPSETIVIVGYTDIGTEEITKEIAIPTKEIYEAGCLVSRRVSGIKFSLISKWLKKNNYYFGKHSLMVKK